MCTLVGFRWCFALDGNEDELEVGKETGIEPVVFSGSMRFLLGDTTGVRHQHG
ncbi:hypothetical protein BHAP_0930 [Bifidobacterium hapali]|uniref:Uncharacterized protein n=1 Tax=Bifidobacterium hapali TaxID=1630172 RepID=A0A261FZU7_9BIFI|nr:hypothetical protein BHAP_0930 [Bifidobacterium hapali]